LASDRKFRCGIARGYPPTSIRFVTFVWIDMNDLTDRGKPKQLLRIGDAAQA